MIQEEGRGKRKDEGKKGKMKDNMESEGRLKRM